MPRGGKRPGAGRKSGTGAIPKGTLEDFARLLSSPKTVDRLLELRLKKFGLTRSKFEAMLAGQGGRCALCDEPLTSGWVIDHDHLTMGVRGLLHTNCNALLGFGNEDPRRFELAIAYLKKHNKFLK
jgi:hypothetical protein